MRGLVSEWRAICFNSRTLGRVRHLPCKYFTTLKVFQFTHPGKGATELAYTLILSFKVSIHAPWEGCDAFGRGIALYF